MLNHSATKLAEYQILKLITQPWVGKFHECDPLQRNRKLVASISTDDQNTILSMQPVIFQQNSILKVHQIKFIK